MPTHPQRPLVLKTGVQFTVKLRYVFPFPYSCFVVRLSCHWLPAAQRVAQPALQPKAWGQEEGRAMGRGFLLAELNSHSAFILSQKWGVPSV